MKGKIHTWNCLKVEGHRLNVGLNDKAYLYENQEGKVYRKPIPCLDCNNIEADTCLAYHVKHICDSNVIGNIVVRTSNTNVLIIMLTHAHSLRSHIQTT